MQYLPCNSALLVQETLFLRRKKNTFICPKISKKKVRKSQQISISRQNMLGLKIFVRDQTFRQRPFVPLHNFCLSGRQYKINVNYPRNYQLPQKLQRAHRVRHYGEYPEQLRRLLPSLPPSYLPCFSLSILQVGNHKRSTYHIIQMYVFYWT